MWGAVGVLWGLQHSVGVGGLRGGALEVSKTPGAPRSLWKGLWGSPSPPSRCPQGFLGVNRGPLGISWGL